MLVQICATFGLSIFLRSLAQFLWTPDFRNIANPLLEGRLEIAGIFIGQPQFYASLVCLLSFLLLYLFVNKSENWTCFTSDSTRSQSSRNIRY